MYHNKTLHEQLGSTEKRKEMSFKCQVSAEAEALFKLYAH
jgi:hypothetical protein